MQIGDSGFRVEGSGQRFRVKDLGFGFELMFRVRVEG